VNTRVGNAAPERAELRSRDQSIANVDENRGKII
jgi:hypothetical protein